VEIDPEARFDIQVIGDWLATPEIVLRYDQAWIGTSGGVDVQILPGTANSVRDAVANLSGHLTPAMINGGGPNSVTLQGMTLGGQKGTSGIGGNGTGTIIGG